MTNTWTIKEKKHKEPICEQSSRGNFPLLKKILQSHSVDYIFTYVDKCIEEVRLGKAVQVVTDNTSNNMVY